MAYQARFPAPFAVLGIMTDGTALAALDFLPPGTPVLEPQDAISSQVCTQLQAYLADPLFSFDLPLALHGTVFQSRVWQALRQIPSGSTQSYGDLAKQLHSAPRAVGQACGANPIPVIIPCHRVLARDGLGGFMNSTGGDPLAIKRWLLQHEHRQPA
ncbi:methylated-DNA-protein-cysteine methyltransferase [Sulfuricella sp. T08]|uniref:methylated-DNA--[protein]-cysteine S-methyltransferase n=1 Tax=Sulfuricella sp. T08 TaxID=1632857 RepID=UPI0006179A59|nr:methylated-DNA--[protein]-cysteine S-methyltransferase [Sulfuricella sp. T08]GAO37076.1 methylated-DNA-protein-cysteine methyltransferase [Sulfuricella sp. T08]